ncbi:MAG: tyrosine-type recombinase/integrase [Chloroflexia bacterium]
MWPCSGPTGSGRPLSAAGPVPDGTTRADLLHQRRYADQSGRNLVRDFQALRERAGLPPMRFHDLRHSCISFLAAQGVPARTAMEIAGHSQITLTMNVYAHIGDEAKRAALGGLGRLLAAGG